MTTRQRLEIYSEKEWFDTFYPKEWGNWQEAYNIGEYIKTPRLSGCVWMDYKLNGIVLSGKKIMKILPWGDNCPYYDHFFIECHPENDAFIQPHFQPKNQKSYASILLNKEESNLDLWKIKVAGNDDSSYSKHFIGLEAAMTELDKIKQKGITYIRNDYKASRFFFTN